MDELFMLKKRARIKLWLKLAFTTVLAAFFLHNAIHWLFFNPYIYYLSLSINIAPFIIANILLCYVSTVFWLVRSYRRLLMRLNAGDTPKIKVKNNWLTFILITLLTFTSAYLSSRPFLKATSQNTLEVSEILDRPLLAVETYFDVNRPYEQTNNLFETKYKNRSSISFEQKINFEKEVHTFIDVSYLKGVTPLLTKGSFANKTENYTAQITPPAEGEYLNYHYQYLNDREILLHRPQGFEYYRFDENGILSIEVYGNCKIDELQLKSDILQICREQFDSLMAGN